MRLQKIREILDEKQVSYSYTEEDGLGSLDFLWRGLAYRVWEYEEAGRRGCETNIFETGRSRDLEGDYENQIVAEMRTWPER